MSLIISGSLRQWIGQKTAKQNNNPFIVGTIVWNWMEELLQLNEWNQIVLNKLPISSIIKIIIIIPLKFQTITQANIFTVVLWVFEPRKGKKEVVN